MEWVILIAIILAAASVFGLFWIVIYTDGLREPIQMPKFRKWYIDGRLYQHRIATTIKEKILMHWEVFWCVFSFGLLECRACKSMGRGWWRDYKDKK